VRSRSCHNLGKPGCWQAPIGDRTVGHRYRADASAWTGYPQPTAIAVDLAQQVADIPWWPKLVIEAETQVTVAPVACIWPAPATPTYRENIQYGDLCTGIRRSEMGRCCLCTGIPGRYTPEDERPCRLAITRVDDGSAYRRLADDQVPRALFDCQPPDTAAPREEYVFDRLSEGRPLATMEEMDDLRAIASAQARQEAGPPYWDMAMFVPASVSLLWASCLATAMQARQAGSQHDARQREADAATVRAAVMEGNATALSYLQREAGCARFGGADWSGRDSRYELGRWEDAHQWVIGSFEQLISLAGGPQIHVHNLVLNLVQTERTGEWGRLDSRSIDQHRGVAAALGCRQTESALTRELGVRWIERADGTGGRSPGSARPR
jgi:hypothetical protein